MNNEKRYQLIHKRCKGAIIMTVLGDTVVPACAKCGSAWTAGYYKIRMPDDWRPLSSNEGMRKTFAAKENK